MITAEFSLIADLQSKQNVFLFGGRGPLSKTPFKLFQDRHTGKVVATCLNRKRRELTALKGSPFTLRQDKKWVKLNEFSVERGSHHDEEHSREDAGVDFSVQKITFGKLAETAPYRCRVLVPARHPLPWQDNFKNTDFSAGSPLHLSSGGLDMSLTIASFDGKDYLVLDVQQRAIYKTMLDAVKSALQALGFVTGIWLNDGLYCFCYPSSGAKRFAAARYQELGKSTRTAFVPFQLGRSVLTSTKVPEVFGDQFRLDPSTLDSLAELIAEDPAVSTALAVLLQYPNTFNALTPTVYLQALTFLSDFYLRKRRPFGDSDLRIDGPLRSKIIQSLRSQLRQYEGRISPQMEKLIQAQLDTIGISDNHHLITLSLAELGITLSKNQQWAIKYAGLGRELLSTHRKGIADNLARECSLILMTLAHLLILSLAGYQGPVYNLYKLFGDPQVVSNAEKSVRMLPGG